MVNSDQQFQAVKAFHQLMDGALPQQPQAYTLANATHRADFKIEEIVEFIAATAKDAREFDQAVQDLHEAVDKAKQKIGNVHQFGDEPLVGQVDALIDLLYFTYGSFVLMGVDPTQIFEVVHAANMGKIWPDGRAHHDPVTNKILKPDNWAHDFAPEGKICEILKQQKSS